MTAIGPRSKVIRAILVLLSLACGSVIAADRPNVILVMADDQGWAQTGYYGHPSEPSLR